MSTKNTAPLARSDILNAKGELLMAGEIGTAEQRVEMAKILRRLTGHAANLFDSTQAEAPIVAPTATVEKSAGPVSSLREMLVSGELDGSPAAKVSLAKALRSL